MKQHIDSASHVRNKEAWGKRELKRNAAAVLDSDDVSMKFQRVTTFKQPTVQHVVDTAAATAPARYAVADDTDDTMFMCLGTGIPPKKLDHPLFRKWVSKYTDINGCIPTLSGNFPKVNIVRLNDGM